MNSLSDSIISSSMFRHCYTEPRATADGGKGKLDGLPLLAVRVRVDPCEIV
jgi:hypothetical protein